MDLSDLLCVLRLWRAKILFNDSIDCQDAPEIIWEFLENSRLEAVHEKACRLYSVTINHSICS